MVLVAAGLTGCGSISGLASLLPGDSGGGGGALQTPTPPRPVDTTPIRAEFKTCEVVPLNEVQSRSPLREDLVLVEPDEGIESRCRYNSSIDPPVDWPNSVVLSIEDALYPEQALANVEQDRQDATDVGYSVSSPSVGDKASAYSESDYASYVSAAKGRYYVHVLVSDSGNLEFPQLPRSQKESFGADILTYTLSQIAE